MTSKNDSKSETFALDTAKARRQFVNSVSVLLDSDTATKADFVKVLKTLEDLWKTEYVKVAPQIKALEEIPERIRQMHTNILSMVQEERDDCSDLKALDGRSLKGIS